MDDVWPDGHVDLTLRTRDPQTRLERLQQRVLRQVPSPAAAGNLSGWWFGPCFIFPYIWE
jgi:hypothetical protein